MWSNADEVKAFIEDHKGKQWVVGDRLVLPDIEQAYEVIAIRPFKHRGKFKLFVDLEAACAVDGCSEYLVTTKEVHQWMASRYLTRCCDGHRHAFTTSMDYAWKTQEERLRMKATEPKETAPRTGINELAVLDAIDDLSLLSDRLRASDVVAHAVGKLPPSAEGVRDTRKQSAVRALQGLIKSGRVTTEGDIIVAM